MADSELTLEATPAGNKWRVVARFAGEVVHLDELNLANAAHRKRFAAAVVEKLPALDPAAIDAELLKIYDTPNPSKTPSALVEVDIGSLARPEYFATPTVSGLTVPVVVDAGGKPVPRWIQYLRWHDGRREYRDLSESIDLENGSRLCIHPLPGEPAVGNAPAWSARSRQAWIGGSKAPSPAEVFQRITATLAHYIELPADTGPGTTATLALWSMLSYGYSCWAAVPYLFIGGPLGSGKSTVFAALNQMVFRPLNSSNMTGPALFRTLHDRGGTLLLDEAERLKQSTPDVQDLLSMLLAGYKRGGQATRLEKVGDEFRTTSFDVYGPKALACIAGLPATLSSRCIRITMFRAGQDSPKPRRRLDADPRWQGIRDDLHVLALEHGHVWRDLSHHTNVCPAHLAGRSFELWQPLLALAGWLDDHGADGLLDMMQTHALELDRDGKDDQVPDADEVLLEILAEKIKLGMNPTPGEILERARDRDKATFDRWTARTVSSKLKAYGIRATKSNGVRSFRDVDLPTLHKIQTNYGIDLGVPGSSSTVPTVPATAEVQFDQAVKQGR